MHRNLVKGQKLSFYIVAWVDMLAQSELLEELAPPTNLEDAEQLKALKQKAAKSIQNVRRFREFARSMAKHLSRVELDRGKLAAIPPKRRRLYKRYKRIRVIHRCFADSVLLAIPLEKSDVFPPFLSIESMFQQIVILTLIMLFARTPIRGAISIGLCTSFEGGELYGRAVARAHSLEAEDARYPRIIVDEDFVDYLKSWQKAEVPEEQKKVNSGFLNLIIQSLERDTDGKLILSYLGRKYPEPYKDKTQLKEVCDFISEQIDVFTKQRKPRGAPR